MIKPWDLTETNLSRMQGSIPEVAVLPISAIEPHNRHLPLGQDFFHTTHVARVCCERAWNKTQSVTLLPALPYGVDCNLMDFPIAVHVSQNTLNLIVTDIINSLHHYGIRKIILLNGHGGNDFKPLIRQLQSDMDVHLFQCNWWKVGLDKYSEIFDEPDDHAGEMETSIALALYPDLVEMEKAGNGQATPFRFEALNKGWVQTSRDFAKLNDHCAAGEPGKASAEKGKRYLELACQRISQFLIELVRERIDPQFPQIALEKSSD